MIQSSKELLGSRVTVSVQDESHADLYVQAALRRCFAECLRIDEAFSRFREGNELAALNSSLGQWCEVSEELYGLLQYAAQVCDKTAGAFDPTVKSVLDSWGYDKDYSFKEGERGFLGELELACGKAKITSELDLGGLGKGYAIDRMVALLLEFKSFSVDAGGDIYSKGGWKTAFEHPLHTDRAIGVLELDGFAVASSSSNRRQWRDRHHLVDPVSLEPALGMLAVYTQADKAIDADAYATALFVMGFEKAKSSLESLPVEAMLISPKGELFRSKSFKGELFTD